MAIRKLSLSLFSAKSGITQTEGSSPYFHLIASIPQTRYRYAFVCESQPLLTLRSHGLPTRCPLCRQENPNRQRKNQG
jgi:hypothetical protein